VPDGGQCRFVGCAFQHCDLHHLQPWENGGNTDIDNGFSACPRHHRMLHHGYRVEGDPNHELRCYRPDGSYLGSTHPAQARLPAAWTRRVNSA
jgi:HNH endonuclease